MTERRPIGLTVPYREVGYKEKKRWVGLTEEQKERLVEMTVNEPQPHHLRELIDEVEAQLREKNG